jgi:hypothetical protein
VEHWNTGILGENQSKMNSNLNHLFSLSFSFANIPSFQYSIIPVLLGFLFGEFGNFRSQVLGDRIVESDHLLPDFSFSVNQERGGNP